MRYWFDGADEDLPREAERWQKLGLGPPAPIPAAAQGLAWFLATGEVLL